MIESFKVVGTLSIYGKKIELFEKTKKTKKRTGPLKNILNHSEMEFSY